MAPPLTRTKVKTTKELYTRPAVVEAEIDQSLTQTDARLAERARVHDPNSGDYLRSETLMHLHRRAVRQGQAGGPFLVALVKRCEANLERTIDKNTPQAKQLREEILAEFAVGLAEDAAEGGDVMDYFECRFNSAFSALRIDMYNRHMRLHNKTAAAPVGAEDESEGDIFVPSAKGATSARTWTPPSMEDAVYLKQVMKFIKTMPRDEQEVIVLCRIMKLTQEVAAARLGVTVKTIFNRLKRADTKLASIKEDA